ncbi:MAG: LuxR family transcriptional regulator [Puniceicoccaceae bacterium]|nr:MAG: LuxR family transcriptional regulator [Puniceicoccaceae bacterium]
MIPKKVIEAARALAHLDRSMLSFTEEVRHVLRILRDAVDADTVNLGTMDYASGEAVHVSLDGFLMTPERVALLPKFINQHPMLRYARQHGEHPPLRFSDFLSRREFEETALYRECYRGYTHSMVTFTVAASAGLNISVVLSRASSDFTDEECAILSIMQPQIQLFIHNALLRRSMGVVAGAEPADRGVIVGVGNRVLMLDERAQAIWTRHLSRQHSRLPLPLARLALRGGIFEQPHPENGRILCASFRGIWEDWTLMLWEIQDPAQLPTPWNLTPREKEIGSWLIRGKGRHEIATLLGISIRTVHKHTEALYRKLEVDNQVAAIQTLGTVFNGQHQSVPSRPLPHTVDHFTLYSEPKAPD